MSHGDVGHALQILFFSCGRKLPTRVVLMSDINFKFTNSLFHAEAKLDGNTFKFNPHKVGMLTTADFHNARVLKLFPHFDRISRN